MTRPTRAHSLSCPRSEVILASCSPPAHVHSRPCIAPRAALWTYLSLGHNLRARPLAHGCPDVLPTRFPARRRMGWLERDGGVFVGVDGEQLPGGAIDGLARRPRRPRRQPGRAGESLRAPPLPTWSTPGIFKYFVTSACVIGAIGVAFAPSSKVRVDGVPCARARLTAPSPIWPPHAHPVRCFLRSQVTLEKGTSLTMDFKRPNCSWRREYMDLNPLGCFRLSLAFEELARLGCAVAGLRRLQTRPLGSVGGHARGRSPPQPASTGSSTRQSWRRSSRPSLSRHARMWRARGPRGTTASAGVLPQKRASGT